MKLHPGALGALTLAVLIGLGAMSVARAASLATEVPHRPLPAGVEQQLLASRGRPSSLDQATSPEVLSPSPDPTRAPLALPSSRLVKPTPASRSELSARSARSVRGTASNYRGTAGFIGQAVVALPGALGGRYTGRVNGYVTVCADRCARLPIVDWCQCYWGSSRQRVVDLSHEAWRLITDLPLSRGLTSVRLVFD